jgi:hypothetical protein
VSSADKVHKQIATNTNFKLFHQNIQGLGNKIDELEIVLSEVNPDVLILSEHWLYDENIYSILLNNMKCVTAYCRTTIKCGGVAIFVSRDTVVKSILNLDRFIIEGVIEISAVVVKVNNKNIIVIGIYRPPNTCFDSFMFKLYDLLRFIFDEYHSMCSNIIVAGDINIDVLKNCTNVNSLKLVLNEFGLSWVINEPTRVTPTCSSCLDNIITNIPSLNHVASVFTTAISDHHGILFSLLGHKIVHNSSFRVTKRIINSDSVEQLGLELSNVNWGSLNNLSFDSFSNKFFHCFNLTCPAVTKTTHKRNNYKIDWINTEIIEARGYIKLFNYALSKDPNDKLREAYKSYIKYYKDLLIEAKKSLIAKKINNSNNIARDMWGVINNIRGIHKEECNIITIYSQGRMISNPKEVANLFNKHFTSVGRNINNKFKNLGYTFRGLRVEKSIYLTPTNKDEVISIVKSLKNSHSVGYDGVSIDVLKNSITYIAEPISAAINHCMETGYFPDELKIAKVVPLHKKNEKTNVNNYRPISILPIFSKLFERVIYKRIIEFLKEHNVLMNNQYGFVKGRSTTLAAVQFIENIIQGLEKKEFVAGIFVDLEKAFDCVNRDILLLKLYNYGLRGVANDLIRSYMSNRKQFVSLKSEKGDISSELINLEFGVPQGSILGPLLFILYINDANVSCIGTQSVFYADDTSIICKRRTPEELEISVNTVIGSLVQYFNENRLNVNISKSVMLDFSFKRDSGFDMQLILDEDSLSKEESINFLGFKLLNSLKWDSHTDSLCNRLSKSNFILGRLNRYCDKDIILKAYHALFTCNFNYGVEIWGSTTKANLKRLLIIQKRAVRIIMGINRLDSCREYFTQLRIMTVVNLYIFKTILLVRFLNPPLNSAFHNYNTRTNCRYHIDTHTTTLHKQSPTHAGIKLCNALPSSLLSLTNLEFKRKLKFWLINNPFYSIEEFFNRLSSNQNCF